jgi:hypothetical protein
LLWDQGMSCHLNREKRRVSSVVVNKISPHLIPRLFQERNKDGWSNSHWEETSLKYNFRLSLLRLISISHHQKVQFTLKWEQEILKISDLSFAVGVRKRRGAMKTNSNETIKKKNRTTSRSNTSKKVKPISHLVLSFSILSIQRSSLSVMCLSQLPRFFNVSFWRASFILHWLL